MGAARLSSKVYTRPVGASHHHFGPFRLDPSEGTLCKGRDRVHLHPKAFAVLTMLVQRSGTVVRKGELLDSVWTDTAVVEAVLTTAIREIRRALGDNARSPTYIETVHGRGYRFLVSSALGSSGGVEERRLVGRASELARLHRRFEAALSGRRSTVFVAGEAGIGKTTVIDAFVEAVETRGVVRVGRGQCIEQHGAGEPYLPVLEALSRFGRSDDGVVEVLQRYAPSWLPHLPALNEAGAASRPATSVQMLRELSEAIEVLTTTQPLILVLEDLHWSDASTVQWLAYVTRRRDPAQLLVVGTYRPVEAITMATSLRAMVGELRSHPQAEEVVLDYLTREDVEELVGERFGSGHGDLAETLHLRTRGHALFTATLLDSLDAAGLMRQQEDGTWRRAATEAEIEALVPDSVRGYIEGRIERLAPAEQTALEAAAVCGATPSVAAIGAALDQHADRVEETLSSLIAQREMIEDAGIQTWPDGTRTLGLSFRHALYQQTLYRRAPSGRRAQMHRRVGRCLERAFGNERAVELAAHFDAAHEPEPAAEYFVLAAAKARLRSAFAESNGHLGRARSQLASLSPSGSRDAVELKLTLEEGSNAMVTGGWAVDAVGVAFDRALELATELGDQTARLRSLFGALGFCLVRGDAERHFTLSQALLQAAEKAGDRPSTVVAHVELGGAALARGRLDEAEASFARGLASYVSEEHEEHKSRFGVDFGAFGYAWWSHLAWLRGDIREGKQHSQSSLSIADGTRHVFTRVVASAYAGVLHMMLDEPIAASRFADEVGDLGARFAIRYYEAWAHIVLGWSKTRGDDRSGLTTIRIGIESLQNAGARRMLPYFLVVFAQACLRLGALSDARRALKDAQALIDGTSETVWQPEIWRLQVSAAEPGCDRQGLLQRAHALAVQMRAGAFVARLRTGEGNGVV